MCTKPFYICADNKFVNLGRADSIFIIDSLSFYSYANHLTSNYLAIVAETERYSLANNS